LSPCETHPLRKKQPIDVAEFIIGRALRGPGGCVPSMIGSLEVKVLYPAWWWRRISKTQGRRREAGSEGSVEQSRDPMNKNRIPRPSRPDEQEANCEVHNHQGSGR